MSPGFGTLLTHIAYEIWSFQREKHWRHGIFVIIRFYQDSELLADASHFHKGSSLRFQNEAETSPAQLSNPVIIVIFSPQQIKINMFGFGCSCSFVLLFLLSPCYRVLSQYCSVFCIYSGALQTRFYHRSKQYEP